MLFYMCVFPGDSVVKNSPTNAGFPGSSVSKESACNSGDPGLIPASGRSPRQEDPLEKEMATHCSILPWEIPRMRSLEGHSPWGHKSWTQLSD